MKDLAVLSLLSEADKAYLAGIIDGEGSITIRRPTTPGRKTRLVSVDISSTAVAWLYELHRKWGSIGSFSHRDKAETAKRKRQANWAVAGRPAQRLLQLVFPYLGIKREQALIALNFKMPGSGRKPSPDLIQAQQDAETRIRLLNKKGPNPFASAAFACTVH